MPAEELPRLAAAHIEIEVDGVIAASGGAADLTAAPEACFADFLAEARAHGFTPHPGDWVATGGATPCAPIADGARVRVLCDGSPALDFQADRSGGD